MDIEFKCDKCGQHITIDEAGAGRAVQCPKCGGNLTVPSAPKQKETTGQDTAFCPQRTSLLVGIMLFAIVALLAGNLCLTASQHYGEWKYKYEEMESKKCFKNRLMIENLDGYGRDGWELVAVLPLPKDETYNRYEVFLKKRVK